MTVRLNPYLNFRDTARQALEFYHSVFGGDLQMSTFKEFQSAQDPAEEDLIMHGQLEGEHGVVLMASDLPKSMPFTPGGSFAVSLSEDCSGSQSTPPSAAKFRPSSQGTKSCGCQSFAIARCRLTFSSATGSSSRSSSMSVSRLVTVRIPRLGVSIRCA